MKKIKSDKPLDLVNGYKLDQKNNIPSSEKRPDVVMTDADLRSIFQQYSNKEINQGIKKVKAGSSDKTAKSGKVNSAYDQGGRIENRKYLINNLIEIYNCFFNFESIPSWYSVKETGTPFGEPAVNE